ncbi:MAG: type IV pilin protein [Steroidobacteraceae bacterium]
MPGNRGAGFTLVELMIVIVIATILISVAIPAYTSQTRKSRRTEAKTAVLDLASREERYFSTNNQYTTDPTLLGYAALGSGATFPQSAGSYYQITVAVPDPSWAGGGPSYLVTATPSAGSQQLQDAQCTSFSVTQTGSQAATGTLGNACW